MKKTIVAAIANFSLFGGRLVYSGRRMVHAVIWGVGVVIFCCAEITFTLRSEKCEVWCAFMAGMICLQRALATDTHREGQEIADEV